jgi:hypothetical protein
MLWTGWFLSFLVVAQLLSSAFFRATYHTYAVAEIVTGYGYPESAIVLIVIAECALVLLYLDDLSYRQIAEVLGIAESNVGVKLNRAKKALGERMKEESHES